MLNCATMLVLPTAMFNVLSAKLYRWQGGIMFIVCLLLYVIAPAQKNALVNYRLIGIEDGLSSREILCGLQDERGFLWFGSGNGITRYDGTNFINLNRSNSSLRGDRVIQMATDNEGLAWVLYSPSFTSQSAGKVDLLNTTNRQVVSFQHRFPKAPFTEANIFSLYANGDGQIQIYLNTGEVYFYSKGIFRKYYGTRSPDITYGHMFNNKVWISDASFSAWWLNSANNTCVKEDERMMIINAEANSDLVVATDNAKQRWHILNENCTLQPIAVNVSKTQL